MENKSDTVCTLLKVFRAKLKNNFDDNEIRQFLYMLFDEWKGWDKAQFHLNQEESLSKAEAGRFHLALEELKNNKPIQYIIGKAYFHGLELIVTPDALIPRPETEELVDLIVKENRNRINEAFSILDIGTGSGCIAVSLKKTFSHSAIYAIDNSVNALELAGKNADRNGCDIRFIHHDIFQIAELPVLSEFDVIVSNPPYIRESEKKEMHKNVLDYEPHGALFVPDNNPLVYYNAISDFAVRHLSRPGLLYLEINERFGQDIKTLLLTKEFDKVEVMKDLNQKDRFIRAEANNPVSL